MCPRAGYGPNASASEESRTSAEPRAHSVRPYKKHYPVRRAEHIRPTQNGVPIPRAEHIRPYEKRESDCGRAHTVRPYKKRYPVRRTADSCLQSQIPFVPHPF